MDGEEREEGAVDNNLDGKKVAVDDEEGSVYDDDDDEGSGEDGDEPKLLTDDCLFACSDGVEFLTIEDIRRMSGNIAISLGLISGLTSC